MRSVLKALFALSLPLLAAQSVMAALPSKRASLLVRWAPKTLVNGSPCLFQVRPSAALKSLTGRWLGRRVYFYFDAATGTWYGFAGVGIDTASGNHQLKLVARSARGARVLSSQSVPVGKTVYPRIGLSVPENFTEPDAETSSRILQERAVKRELFEHFTQKRLWAGRFVPPVKSVVTDKFGTERIFNGRRQSVHQGLDFRASIGTPVEAMNSGRVIIAREMFYEGGFVVIDHGCGLATLYMHLDRINVSEGERVRRSQIIGDSGSTGRATGPHLHVGVRWQGIYVDPEALLRLSMN
jgi:murein DD-endopeptidase MepM/ murein hydrolase activator NlpD